MDGQKMQQAIDAAVKEEITRRARKAGLAGGPARAKALSARRRSQIAKKAAQARWGKK